MKKILVIIFLASFLFTNFVLAQGYKISVSLPGAPKGTEVRDPSEYISILFKAGLAVAGVLALVFLLYGAILYTVSSSRGNVQGEAQAKERIYSVFLGLGLLLLSYLILYTINPDLVKLKMPKMKVSPEVATPRGAGEDQTSSDIQAKIKACREEVRENECKNVCDPNSERYDIDECERCVYRHCNPKKFQPQQPQSPSQPSAKSCIEKALTGKCKTVCQDVYYDYILSNTVPNQPHLKSLVNKCKECLNKECPNQ